MFVRGVPVTFENYRALVMENRVGDLHNDPGDWFIHCVLKYAGEAGEFPEHVGKAQRDDGWRVRYGPKAFTPERREKLLSEIGDELWYVVALLEEMDSTLEEVMAINMEKMLGRRDRGTLNGSGDDR